MQLIEHYLSLQGEGLRTGHLTYFVRFARCNLRCAWCDSSFTFGKGASVDFATLEASVADSRAKFVCLTGGEPLLHSRDCLRLIRRFPKLHFDIETGGSLNIRSVQRKNTSVIMDWKLERSGMGHRMKKSNLSILRPQKDLLKCVTDGSPGELEQILRLADQTARTGLPISVQPVYPTLSAPSPRCRSLKKKHSLRDLADWVIQTKNPRLRFSLQTHKHIWDPDERGV